MTRWVPGAIAGALVLLATYDITRARRVSRRAASVWHIVRAVSAAIFLAPVVLAKVFANIEIPLLLVLLGISATVGFFSLALSTMVLYGLKAGSRAAEEARKAGADA